MGLLEEGLAYLEFGLNVLPVSGKASVVAWKEYQTRRITPCELTLLFKTRKNISGLGALNGPISDHWCVRDFDIEERFQLWKSKFPHWASKLAIAKTFKGAHVYFRHVPDLGVIKCGDGELRGGNGYTLLPPSLHPEGIKYEWIRPIEEGFREFVDPLEIGLFDFFKPETPVIKKIETIQTIKKIKKIETIQKIEDVMNESFQSFDGETIGQDLLEELSVIAAKHRATRPNTNNRHLFNMARALISRFKALGVSRGSTEANAISRALLELWHSNSPYLRSGTDLEDYWLEFRDILEVTRLGSDESLVAEILKRVDESQDNAPCDELEGLILRTCLTCRELAAQTEGTKFYLPRNFWAKHLETDHPMVIQRRLKELERRGIIEALDRGSSRDRRAGIFRFKF